VDARVLTAFFVHLLLSSQLYDSIAKTKELAGVKVELLTVGQQQIVWVSHNFAFLGGSLGCAEGEKITRAFEYATEHKVKNISGYLFVFILHLP
jgi:acetyl-CoA carboxylase beta subunit